ncbi:MAG: hypothetical protein KDE19_16280 [Caldilineaceae bacterium]|nr:hypothetical protein [Caldilineaceae bacterium]
MGPIIEQRWSTCWLRMLQNLDLLPIDAQIDSRSRIRRMEVAKGMVSAEVKSRQHGLCQVTIAFAPLPNQAWEELQSLFLQQVTGALPLESQLLFSEKEATFPQVSALLLPKHVGEIQPQCSCCPTDEQQCPALQLVYHQVGAMLDEEPVLLLRLRGRDWQQLAQELQEQRTGSYPHANAAGGVLTNLNMKQETPADQAVAGENDSLVAEIGNFWGSRRALETFHHHIAPPQIDLTILRRLGPLPDVLNDPVVDQQLAMLYRHVTHEAEALAYDLDGDDLHEP